MVQNIAENFVEHAGLPKRGWQGHTNFLSRKILRKWMNFFPQFILHRVGCGSKYFGKYCQAWSVA